MRNGKTLIFDIEKFAVHDGPGIRTVIFMKGCPLHCLWCHNPESQSFLPEIMFNSNKCTICGNCKNVCHESCHIFDKQKHIFDRSKCKKCGKCVNECPSDALLLSGREMNVDEILTEVMKDKIFYERSGGGVTLSGGEPLAHFDFTYKLLSALKKNNIHTAIETSGFAPYEHIQKIFPFVDLWLWDVKANHDNHKSLTGVDDSLILDNLKKISEENASIILRCPLIPNITDDEIHLKYIAELANSVDGVKAIDLEPYHPLGENKNVQLGRNLAFHGNFLSENSKKFLKETICRFTSVPVHI